MSDTLEIQLLGDFALRQNGRPLTDLDSPRLQALLAYLLLHQGAPQLRQHIAFTFWPDSDEGQARTNLRNLLHRLRQAWPDVDQFLTIETKSVRWRASAPARLDTAEFEQAVQQAQAAVDQAQAAVDPAAALGHWRRAIALYQGDLLPGCYDDWILPERARLSQLFRQALAAAVNLAADQKDYPTAVQIGRQLLETDPLSETGYRQLMQLYARSGDRAAALRVYYQCVSTLRREMDVAPSAATQAAYQQLIAPDTTPPVPASELAGELAEEPAREPALIGRQGEWKQLTALWRQTVAEQTNADRPPRSPALLLISGEAGIGKTRLAEELLAWVRRQGATTAVTSCYAAEAEQAFAPLAGWLRTLPLERLPPLWRSELARLRPQLLLDDPSLPPPGPLTESWQQQRFFTALTQAVQTTRQPTLLLLDDLQWCDGETLAWLHTLLRRPPPSRLLFLATYRREEVANPALESLLATGRQTGRLTTLSLKRLSADETAALVAGLLPHAPEAETADALFRHTEGNPLFIVETVRAMQGDWQIGAGSHLPLPDTVQAMLETRLARLSPMARDITNLAATIGRSFTFDVLVQASDLDEDQLVTALDELWQRRIVISQGENDYDFSHEKLREVAYGALSPARRRWLHGRILDALHTLHRDQLDEAIGALAHHAARAGRREEAGQYALQTGELALNRFAYREAASHFTQALNFLSPQRTTDLYNALNGRAQAWQLLNDQAALQADLSRLQTLVDAQAMPRWQAEVAWRRAELAWLQGDQAAAQQFVETGLTLAREAGDGAREAAFLETMARIARNQGDYRQARRWVEEAHERFTAVGHRFGIASTLDKLANLTFEEGDAAEAAVMHAAAAAIFRDLQAAPYEARALSGRGLALKMMGDYEAARQTHLQLLATAEAFDDRHNQWTQQILLGSVACELGDYGTAVDWYRRALSLAQQLNNPRDLSMTFSNLGEAYREQGAAEEALRYYGEGLTLNREKGFDRGEANCLNGIGLTRLDQGRPADARAALEAACALWRSLGERLKRIESLAGLALAALDEGRQAEAQTHITAALSDLNEEDSPMWRRWIYFAAYKVWLAAGEEATAVAYLRKAAQAVAEINAKLPLEARERFQQTRLNRQITAAQRQT